MKHIPFGLWCATALATIAYAATTSVACACASSILLAATIASEAARAARRARRRGIPAAPDLGTISRCDWCSDTGTDVSYADCGCTSPCPEIGWCRARQEMTSR